MKGRIVTEETREKISNTLKGKFCGGQNPFSRKIVQFDLNDNIIKEFDSIADAVRFLNLKYSGGICNCLKGRNITAHGYKWKYKNETI